MKTPLSEERIRPPDQHSNQTKSNHLVVGYESECQAPVGGVAYSLKVELRVM